MDLSTKVVFDLTGDVSLSRILQNLSQRYTMWVNRRRGRTGHVFQGRYKAILLDADTYLLELVRYIHLNPVRAGVVKWAEEYPWSSQRAYLGKEKFTWLKTDWVLSQFSSRVGRARRRYREFIMEGMEEGRRQEFHSGTKEGRILGDDRFANEVLKLTKERTGHRVALDEILERVCNLHGKRVEEVIAVGKVRGASQARAMICWLVREAGHLSLTELSKRLNRDISGLSMAAARLVESSKTDSLLAARMAKLKLELL